jgi:hypothetical protein
MTPYYPQEHALNILFCSLQRGLIKRKHFMDVDMFRTQRKRETERQRLGSVYIHINKKGV